MQVLEVNLTVFLYPSISVLLQHLVLLKNKGTPFGLNRTWSKKYTILSIAISRSNYAEESRGTFGQNNLNRDMNVSGKISFNSNRVLRILNEFHQTND